MLLVVFFSSMLSKHKYRNRSRILFHIFFWGGNAHNICIFGKNLFGFRMVISLYVTVRLKLQKEYYSFLKDSLKHWENKPNQKQWSAICCIVDWKISRLNHDRMRALYHHNFTYSIIVEWNFSIFVFLYNGNLRPLMSVVIERLTLHAPNISYFSTSVRAVKIWKRSIFVVAHQFEREILGRIERLVR